MQKVSWVIVGLLIGMLVATMVPVQAHHRRSAYNLDKRLDVLESKTRYIDRYGYFDANYIDRPSLCSANDPAVWDFSGLDC